MKKIVTAAMMAVLLGLIGCADPKKDMEAAKAAIDRAQTVEADQYAQTEFKQATDDYDSANKFVQEKKAKDAITKAKSSKTWADKSYDIALENRAESIYKECSELMNKVTENSAEKIDPDRYQVAVSDMESLKGVYESKDYMATYSNGITTLSNLKLINGYVTGEIFKAENHVAEAQDKYDSVKTKGDVIKYAAEKLSEAKGYLDKAVSFLESRDLPDCHTNADLAIAALNESEKIANDAAKAPTQTDVDKQKAKEKAEELMKEAKQKMDKLKETMKKDKKTGFVEIKLHKFALAEAKFVLVGKPLEVIDESDDEELQSDETMDSGTPATSSTDSTETIDEDMADDEETPSMELVEKYYKLAEEAYNREEYLDAQMYAKKAIWYADQLLAPVAEKTYTVILNPKDRDCLWKIANKMYDNKYWMWPIIWRANKFQIKDPDLIYPGQVFKIPPAIDEKK